MNPQEFKGIDIMALARTLWEAMLPFLNDVIYIGSQFLTFFLVIEIMKSAIDLAVHHTLTIDRKIITYALILLFFGTFYHGRGGDYSNYAKVAHTLYQTSIVIMEKKYDELAVLRQTNLESLKHLYQVQSMKFDVGGMVAGALGLRADQIVAKIADMICSILMAFADLVILGTFVGYILLLFMGPFLLPFFMSPSYRGVAMNWLTNVLSNFILFPMISMSLVFSKALCEAAIDQLGINSKNYDYYGVTYYWSIFIIVLLPIMLLVITLQYSKSILHGMGASGTSILQPVTAALSVAMMASSAATKMVKSSISSFSSNSMSKTSAGSRPDSSVMRKNTHPKT